MDLPRYSDSMGRLHDQRLGEQARISGDPSSGSERLHEHHSGKLVILVNSQRHSSHF
ncbi:hypothetical protein BDR04DRAFT_1087172 [Suillus decipiens]|nr:hypothetical protein BDR04DRAFT_1111796 [Suillus decipiens]KAG2078661.1 hypothetical protein BDR04DRAFT_1087172 [Suillus decipiens]